MKRNPRLPGWLGPAFTCALLIYTVWIARGSIAAEAAADDAPAVSGRDVDLDRRLPLDPALERGKLDNGLTYYIRANRKPENRAELRLIVNAGSMQEDDDQRGLAHLVEHMAFNGTRHFEKQELVDYLESIGMRFGPDLNAYTSFDETVYMLQVPTDDREILEKAFLILDDWASGVAFEDEEIEKERDVVLEEWRQGRGADARIRDRQFPTLFKGSRYADRLVIGDPEIIETAPPDRVRQFYKDWYRPDLMAVVAVGDFDPEAIESLIREHFGDLEGPDTPRVREMYPVPGHEETLVAIATDPEATRSSVGIYTKLPKRPEGTVGDYRRALVEGLYHGMLNERLSELVQKPNPPFLYAVSQSGGFVRSKDVLVQMAGVEDDKVEEGLRALLREVERVDRHGFTQSELDRMKTNLLRMYEQIYRERDKQQSARFTWEYVANFLEEEPSPGIEFEYELVRQLLPGIPLEEINAAAEEWITDENRVILFSGPEKDGVTPPTSDELLALLSRTEAEDIEPYRDDTLDQPLVEAPEPGSIEEERRVEEIGVTEWTLSNGARVVLKPTDFQNDEIRFSAFSPGGHSLVPDDAYISALYATSVLGAGGLGDFDRVQLEKALAGKVANVGAYISELEEGLGGAASPKDAETLFQLIHLWFTSPRKDPDAVRAWKERSEAALENRLSRPETVFGDRWSKTLTGDHFRRQPPSVERLERVDLDVAHRVYRERFADAGDFTFIFVGNFELEEMRPFVRAYLASLPAMDRTETWRDVGVSRPEGRVEFEVHQGLEPKSLVRMFFHGDAEWSREEDRLISALAGVLRIRLRELLREDLGGTYGVGVGGGISRRPSEEYSFSISFGTAPEKADDLIGAVFKEIERVKEEGIETSYVEKVKEGYLRSYEVGLKENPFWLSSLETAYTFDTDPKEILRFPELVETITPERVRQAAQRYLKTDRVVIGVLYPEKSED